MEITVTAYVECAKCRDVLKAIFVNDGEFEGPEYVIKVEPCKKCAEKMAFDEYQKKYLKLNE